MNSKPKYVRLSKEQAVNIACNLAKKEEISSTPLLKVILALYAKEDYCIFETDKIESTLIHLAALKAECDLITGLRQKIKALNLKEA